MTRLKIELPGTKTYTWQEPQVPIFIQSQIRNNAHLESRKEPTHISVYEIIIIVVPAKAQVHGIESNGESNGEYSG